MKFRRIVAPTLVAGALLMGGIAHAEQNQPNQGTFQVGMHKAGMMGKQFRNHTKLTDAQKSCIKVASDKEHEIVSSARTVLNNAIKANPGDAGKEARKAARKVYKDAMKSARKDFRQSMQTCMLPITVQ